jgi:hypothetical protein
MTLGVNIHGKNFATKNVPIIAPEINGMKLKYRLAYHDEAYLILCIYERDDIDDKILTMHMTEQIVNRLTFHLVDCRRVVGITLVGRGPEKSCGTRILGLAKDGAVSAQALHSG